MAETKSPTKAQLGDLGKPNPSSYDELAEDVVPLKDDEQRAYKDQLQADSGQAEAKAKVKRVESDASPDAEYTPSGAALKAVAGVSNDVERGEKYADVKASVRHGLVSPEEAAKKS